MTNNIQFWKNSGWWTVFITIALTFIGGMSWLFTLSATVNKITENTKEAFEEQRTFNKSMVEELREDKRDINRLKIDSAVMFSRLENIERILLKIEKKL